jgi:hypothetical protein
LDAARLCRRAAGEAAVTIALVLAGVALLAFLLAIGLGPKKQDLRFDQLHHEYEGLLLVLIAFAVKAAIGGVLRWTGVALMLDDALEHSVQRLTGDLFWQSPLHRLYGLVYARWAWVRELNAWLDARLR